MECKGLINVNTQFIQAPGNVCDLLLSIMTILFGSKSSLSESPFHRSMKTTRGKSKKDRAGPIAIKYVDNVQYHTASLRHSKKGENIRIVT